MKRTVPLTVTLILVMISLVGCCIIPIYKHFEIDQQTVESIELYDLCDDPYDPLEKEPAYEIPQEQKAEFLQDLAKIKFTDVILIVLAAVDPSFYYDTWTVRINYTDGSFELISADGYGQVFDANGEQTDGHHFGCEQEEWDAFLVKYLPEELWNHSHNE